MVQWGHRAQWGKVSDCREGRPGKGRQSRWGAPAEEGPDEQCDGGLKQEGKGAGEVGR